MSRLMLFVTMSCLVYSVASQPFTRKDSLRGNLTNIRTCYDVTFYDLFVIIDDQEHSIEKSYNIIYFDVVSEFNKIQIDLANNMEIISVDFEDAKLDFIREFDAVIISFPRTLNKGEKSFIKVWYQGYPREAVNPPWDGGFSWSSDDNGNPWIGVSCQGLGASSWWPCKDHQSDEPDSMRITCTVRDPLQIISNGDLRKDTSVWNQYLNSWVNIREWFVSYPINNYNVTLNIGNYTNFSDSYISGKDTLRLDYYVLDYNLEKARIHFRQVNSMMKCFEHYFGKYPFYNDGYALVETSYLGMEHQSAIAYGNNFLPGYNGNISFINNLEFDFIIIHETGHEWWGNAITTNDIADMWVHEGFCTYSEVLYVECMYGYEEMLSYVNNQKRRIKNDSPVLGAYHVNSEGSSDMYFKGSLMLHTLRSLVADDVLWFQLIKAIIDKFKYQTIDGDDVISYIDSTINKDLTYFFDQYLSSKHIPEFQYKFERDGRGIVLLYRWEAVTNFKMPVLINTGQEDFWIYPQERWQEIDLGSFDKNAFRIRDDLFLIDIKKY